MLTMSIVLFIVLVAIILFGFLFNDSLFSFLLLPATFVLFMPFVFYTHQLINLSLADSVVEEHINFVKSLEVQMKDLPNVNQNLMNADTPYASLSSQLTEAREGLLLARLDKVKTVGKVKGIEVGLFQYVTWFISKEDISD